MRWRVVVVLLTTALAACSGPVRVFNSPPPTVTPTREVAPARIPEATIAPAPPTAPGVPLVNPTPNATQVANFPTATATLPARPTSAPPTSTPTLTTSEMQAFLLSEVRAYAVIFGKYAPPTSNCRGENCPRLDWRPLDLALEPWLPQHPAFARYYAWTIRRMGNSFFADLARYPEYLGDSSFIARYLAGEP